MLENRGQPPWDRAKGKRTLGGKYRIISIITEPQLLHRENGVTGRVVILHGCQVPGTLLAYNSVEQIIRRWYGIMVKNP